MKSYKIKVNDEAESKEAQELFEQLGFTWAGDNPENGDWYSHLYAENSTCCYLSPYVWGGLGDRFKELTLPQLRDLVVLHRNDVKDATHKGERENLALLCSDGAEYFWNYSTKKWFKTEIMTFENKNMKPIQSEADQGLISGADVPALLKNGQFVQYRVPPNGSFKGGEWVDVNLEKDEEEFSLGDFINARYEWRLKPCTIKLSIEIPEPFEPKEGEAYWVLNPYCDKGYCEERHIKEYTTLGAWRSEEEIRKVVEALKQGFKL